MNPALTETKEPAGGPGLATPIFPSRRRSRRSSTRRVVIPGADGDEGTCGRRGRPSSSLPQQATEPSLLNPQVWSHPALTETKEPAGGVDSPSSS